MFYRKTVYTNRVPNRYSAVPIRTSHDPLHFPLQTPYRHLFSQNSGPDPKNLHDNYLEALPEVYFLSQVMSVSKKLRSHLLAFRCSQVRSAPPSCSCASCLSFTRSCYSRLGQCPKLFFCNCFGKPSQSTEGSDSHVRVNFICRHVYIVFVGAAPPASED